MTLEFIKMIKWWLFKKLHFKRKWNSSQRMAVYKDPELTFFHRHTKSILAHRAVPKMPTLMGWQEMKLSLFADGMILVRSPREGNSNPLQYSCLDNPIDRGAWWAIVQSIGSQRVGHDWSYLTHSLKNKILQYRGLKIYLGYTTKNRKDKQAITRIMSHW